MNAGPDPQKLKNAAGRLRESKRATALTGAGVSAESGVPTFREAEGLWKSYRPEDLASPDAFKKNPEIVWEWYNWRRELIAEKEPNPAHLALAALEKEIGLTLITQNVDGLHEKAGSKNLLELHGSIWRLKCTGCGRVVPDRTVPLTPIPVCPECRSLYRPDVVWFGETLNAQVLEKAFYSAASSDVMLVVGTSALVQPAASLAWQAKRAGAFVIEINMEATDFSPEADLVLTGPAGKILPQLTAP